MGKIRKRVKLKGNVFGLRVYFDKDHFVKVEKKGNSKHLEFIFTKIIFEYLINKKGIFRILFL
jgi:hypothetical protein